MKRRNFLGGLFALPFLVRIPETKEPQWNKKPIPITNNNEERWIPALRAKRALHHIDSRWFCDRITSRGCIVELIDENIVRPGQHDGTPMGILLDDVVGIDLRGGYYNHDGTTLLGGKVRVCSRGEVVARCNGNAQVDMSAYYTPETGILTTEPDSQPIGQFMSSVDEHGYAAVRINI
jgi:hypothetical protein